MSRQNGFVTRPFGAPLVASLPAIGLSFVLVALLTAGIAATSLITDLSHVTIIYLIPVLVAAIRGGI
ncbi:MAG: hypothetical protein WCD75_10375, partial [Rhodoplanes sp.]